MNNDHSCGIKSIDYARDLYLKIFGCCLPRFGYRDMMDAITTYYSSSSQHATNNNLKQKHLLIIHNMKDYLLETSYNQLNLNENKTNASENGKFLKDIIDISFHQDSTLVVIFECIDVQLWDQCKSLLSAKVSVSRDATMSNNSSSSDTNNDNLTSNISHINLRNYTSEQLINITDKRISSCFSDNFMINFAKSVCYLFTYWLCVA